MMRLYSQTGNNPDNTLNWMYKQKLRAWGTQTGTDSNQTMPLDSVSPMNFDVNYYNNAVAGKGLLTSDEVLYSTKGSITTGLVESYRTNTHAFFKQFAASMIKMGNISTLTGARGEIRRNCRRMN
jgi:peroxidase